MNREVEARLKISAVDRTGNALKSVAGRLASVNKQAASLNRQNGVLAQSSAVAYAAMARYAAPAAIAYGAKKAIVDFAQVERMMTRIGNTADASTQEIGAAFSVLQTETKKLAMPVEQGIAALDTMVASGMSLKEAMAFLPSVLATAQASGAATEDIANTGLKAASALKIETDQLQRAFDIMVMGGKAGQFELKDMAQYIPGLANSFATLGYEGEDGLKKLIALLQTIREDTGDASSAATQAQNVFGKMASEETINKFAKFGVNLSKEMQAAAKAGEDAITAFVRISKKALNGDLEKLPLLFSDQDFRLGMQSLITSEQSLTKFLDTMNSAEVDGVVFRDLNRVLSDTQASIDRMSSSWDKMWTSIGSAASKPATAVMDAISTDVDYGEAVRKGLEKQGMGYWEREAWMLKNMPLGSFSKGPASDRVALDGGYSDPEFLKKYQFGPNTPEGWKGPDPEFPGGGTGAMPVPGKKPVNLPPVRFPTEVPPDLKAPPQIVVPSVAAMPTLRDLPELPSPREAGNALRFNIPSYGKKGSDARRSTTLTEDDVKTAIGAESRGRLIAGMSSTDDINAALREGSDNLARSGEDAGRKVADAGREAGKAIEDGGAFFKVAGMDVGAALMAAADKMLAASVNFGKANAIIGAGVQGRAVNADTGRSMPPSAGQPIGSGGGGGY